MLRLTPSLVRRSVAVFALAAVPVLRAQAPDSFVWQYSSPAEQGVDPVPLARMFAMLQRDGIPIHSFILIRHDRIVAESYFYPYTAATLHPMYSVSKSFTSSLVGIAIDQGLLSGVDERVLDVFEGVTDHPAGGNMDRMRLRHLLSMSTGHATDTTNRITYSGNWEKTFLELPVEYEPGSTFVYNSGGSYMLAAAVQQRAGMTTAEFARRHLFGPLGIIDYTWDVSPNNVVCGGWGLSLRPLDMARFGLMYLHDGQWNGRQVVPSSWVRQASQKQVNNGTSGFWGSGYGYQFWMNDFGGYRADGAFAQYIFILPDRDLVAVFTNYLSSDTERPGRYLREYVLPTLSAEPLAANPRADGLLERAAAASLATPGMPVAPTFTTLPESQTVSAGSRASFSVVPAGSPAPTCEWYKDELPISGATGTTLILNAVTALDAGEYVAVLRNSVGATASFPVTLTVLSAPAILVGPASTAAAEGRDAEFTVEAVGGDLTYAWRKNGAAIAGANAAVLRLPAVGTTDAGEYTVAVTNSHGTTVSMAAKLVVYAPETRARLVNLSARALAGKGDQTLIVGLVVDGPDRSVGLPVLLRGVGPTLERLQVKGWLADPAMILFGDGVPFASNSDWRGAPLLAELMNRAGAFTLPSRSADAGLRRVLRPHGYTLHVVTGLPDRTGVALAECYDASGGTGIGGPWLSNLSARAFTGPDDATLIGGFVIQGTGTCRVLMRAVGPTLQTQGVGDVLADPELHLFAGGAEKAVNDDWNGDPALRAAFRQVGAFDLPDHSTDAAMVVELPAGIYSAHVRGKNGGRGVALFELYRLP